MQLLGDACESFRTNCVAGLDVDGYRLADLEQKSLMLVTALAPVIGYDKAAQIACTAHAERSTLKQAAVKLRFVSADEFDRLVDPRSGIFHFSVYTSFRCPSGEIGQVFQNTPEFIFTTENTREHRGQ